MMMKIIIDNGVKDTHFEQTSHTNWGNKAITDPWKIMLWSSFGFTLTGVDDCNMNSLKIITMRYVETCPTKCLIILKYSL